MEKKRKYTQYGLHLLATSVLLFSQLASPLQIVHALTEESSTSTSLKEESSNTSNVNTTTSGENSKVRESEKNKSIPSSTNTNSDVQTQKDTFKTTESKTNIQESQPILKSSSTYALNSNIDDITLTLDDDGTLHIPKGRIESKSSKVNISISGSLGDDVSKAKQIVFDGSPNATVMKGDLQAFLGNLPNLVSVKGLSNVNTSGVTNMKGMFQEDNQLQSVDLTSLDTSSVTDMSYMFAHNSQLQSVDLSTFDTSKVTNMSYMFSGDLSIQELDVSNFNTSNVTNMMQMFDGLGIKELDLSNFDTSKVTNMSYMFAASTSLETVNLSSFDTSKVTNMSYMFSGDSTITELDLSNFNTSAVTDMSGMFSGNTSLKKVNVSSFNTSNVTNFMSMFTSDNNLEILDLSSFTVSKEANKMVMLKLTVPVLVLGKNITMDGTGLLPIPSREGYTGKWINLGSGGSIDHPLGSNIWTSEELMSNYDGSKDADTYIWQKNAPDAVVKYVDEGNNTSIHDDKNISGGIGDHYDATTDDYKLTIPGYTLDTTKIPSNVQGTFTDEAQTITYLYKKDVVQAQDVIVKYVDEKGNPIHEDKHISGNVGDHYDATTDDYKLTIPGYTLDTTKLPSNATGSLTEDSQTVTYVYDFAEVPGNPDPDGPDPQPGTGGDLSIDFVPSLYFGLNSVETKDSQYKAYAVPIKQNGQIIRYDSNYVQVSDNREMSTGWSLSVAERNNFMTDKGNVLNGTQISLSRSQVSNVGGEIAPSSVASDIQILPNNEAQKFITAESGEGQGTWKDSWGEVETENRYTSIEGQEEPQLKEAQVNNGVSLFVPGSSKKVSERYVTDLDWVLSDTP